MFRDYFNSIASGGKPVSPSFGLTSLGTIRADKMEGATPECKVLAAIRQNDCPMRISEISNETHLPPDKVKMVVKKAIADGLIKRVSA